MVEVTSGIHHVTAIAGEPQRNVDFYVGLLELLPFLRVPAVGSK